MSFNDNLRLSCEHEIQHDLILYVAFQSAFRYEINLCEVDRETQSAGKPDKIIPYPMNPPESPG